MKTFFVAGLILSSTLLRAEPAGINPPSDASEAAQPHTAEGMWTQISNQGRQVMVGLQNHDPAVQMQIPTLQRYLKSYLMNYPGDTHVPEARLMSAQVDDLARGLQLPGAPTAPQVAQQFDAIAADTRMPQQLRAEASLMRITAVIRDARAGSNPAAWDDVDAKISSFEHDFGTVSFDGKMTAATMLRAEQIKLLQETGDQARLTALMAKLANDPTPQIAALARPTAVGAK